MLFIGTTRNLLLFFWGLRRHDACSLCLRASGEKRAQVSQAISSRGEDHDGDPPARYVLLIRKVCVKSDEGIEGGLCQFQKFAILFASPAGFLDGPAFVTTSGEEDSERSRRALVNQDLYRS